MRRCGATASERCSTPITLALPVAQVVAMELVGAEETIRLPAAPASFFPVPALSGAAAPGRGEGRLADRLDRLSPAAPFLLSERRRSRPTATRRRRVSRRRRPLPLQPRPRTPNRRRPVPPAAVLTKESRMLLAGGARRRATDLAVARPQSFSQAQRFAEPCPLTTGDRRSLDRRGDRAPGLLAGRGSAPLQQCRLRCDAGASEPGGGPVPDPGPARPSAQGDGLA
jgi:hypothetical protein